MRRNRSRWWWVGLIALCVALPGLADDTTNYRAVRNDKDTNIEEVSVGISLPAGRRIKDIKVVRAVPVPGRPDLVTPVDESAGWTGTGKDPAVKQPKAGTFQIEVKRTTAAAVPKGTTVSICITTDTNDVGITAADVKYATAGGPQGALQRSFDRVPGFATATLDSAGFAGGAAGLTLAGVGASIPAGKYAYLYQLGNLDDGTGTAAIQEFRLANVGSFEQFLVLDGSHDGSAFPGYFSPDPFGPGLAVDVPTFDGLGAGGVVPLSWGLEGTDAVARFAGLAPGQSSRILMALSDGPPGTPSANNAFISGAGFSADNLLLVPDPVPAPGGLVLLLGGGLSALFVRAARRRAGDR